MFFLMFRPDSLHFQYLEGEVDAIEQKSEHLEARASRRWEVAVLPPGAGRQGQDGR